MMRTLLFAVTTAAVLGCGRARESTDESTSHSGTTQSSVVSQEHEHLTPSGWPWTSAAYPTGWADQAERRQHEIEFASGAETPITPPSAIGGGPIDFED